MACFKLAFSFTGMRFPETSRVSSQLRNLKLLTCSKLGYHSPQQPNQVTLPWGLDWNFSGDPNLQMSLGVLRSSALGRGRKEKEQPTDLSIRDSQNPSWDGLSLWRLELEEDQTVCHTQSSWAIFVSFRFSKQPWFLTMFNFYSLSHMLLALNPSVVV